MGDRVVKRYGLILGRFQPFHLGHQQIISEIIADGLTPIVLIGGKNRDDDKHPFTFEQVSDMIHLVFQENILKVVGVDDNPNWDEWMLHLLSSIPSKDDVVVYYNNKNIDAGEFVFMGKTLMGHWNKCFELLGFETRRVTHPQKLKLTRLNATHLRKDLEKYRHYLDGRVYQYIKKNN